MKRTLLVLLALAVAATLSFATGTSEKKVEISWQVWETPNLTREFYDGVVKAFEAKNPGITVKIIDTNANVTPAADDFIKTRLAAGDVPDLMSNLTVSFFADGGQLWPIPTNDPDLKAVPNLQAAAYKGKLYSFNSSVQPQGLMFYNKALFAKAGITATPKTWAEFEADCAKLKAAGITPIITGGQWVAGYAFVTLTSPEIYHNDLNWYGDRWAGKVHFTDANYVEAANWFNGLVGKGYFNEGALSIEYSALEQHFLAGEAAIYPMGSWFTAADANAKKDWETGVFFSPTKDGKPHLLQSLSFGTTPVIYAKSKNPEAAWKLLKFAMMDPTVGAKFIQVDGLFSALNPPLTYEMTPLQKALGALLPTAKTTSSLYNLKVGEMPPAGLTAIYDKVGQTLLAGGVTDVKPLMQQLDDFWNQAKQ
jgi:ABC-type glycerol-3-phosphate transport system substrate-binding protein